ncbi:Mov34/MPN/PAD-1 family protein [Burkholderia sp. USMB20]|uniref:Mov34/MPN/PAD-1 family protein n=1 Tax=Burkholderia sp. USMB20 TaxID=1571773 RepID=UPI0005CE557A|nr:Mov34/MPN/PAD-1 family protein [Burkholderia sp. USMB20]TGN96131.1 phage tail protein [Burkholderia sp. USMB20]
MQPDTLQQIKDHAVTEYPSESCGFVVTDHRTGAERYLQVRNRTTKIGEQFKVAAEDFAAAEDVGEISMFVHSHPGGRARPSPADLTMAEAAGIPEWGIVSLGVQADHTIGCDDWYTFKPSGYVAPLLGRPFVHGVHDCYSLIRDWYAVQGIAIPDFPRPDKWWDDGKSNLYLDGYTKAGFLNLGPDAEPQEGDVLLMQIFSKNGVPNHGAVYIGGGRIMHHMYDRLSKTDLWGGMYRNCLSTVLRHKEMQ